RLLGLLALVACTRDVYVPLEVVAPTGSGTLRLEVVITPEGACGTTRPAMAGTRFDEGEATELGLERGSTALWVGAWEGDTCGAGTCYAGCTVVDVRKGVDARVTLAPTDCANVCGSTSDAGLDAGLEDAGPVDAPPMDAPFDVPVDAPTDAPDGSVPGECNTGYVAVAAGYDHTCALRADGEVYCWGTNTRGQCGAAASPTAGPSLVNLGGPAVQIGAGDEFSCARLADGRVACWGYDGPDNQDRNGDATVGESNHLPVFVQSSTGGDLTGATDLAVGYWHACALVGGVVRCWGQNASGELGTGDCTAPGGCRDVRGWHEVPGLTSVTSLGLGVGSSCARLSSGQVRCWGYNARMQLSVSTGATAVSSPSTVLMGGSALGEIRALAGGGTRSFDSMAGTPGLFATTCGFDA
ncbi:MAG: hypothetical protein KC586_03895, partial [Myxococcales bacterium]|nr:hypothetical protein [Myxococcales bacterium]